MKTGAAYALLVVMATLLGTAFTDSPPRPPPPPPPPTGLEPPPAPPCLEARSHHLPAPPPQPPSYPSGGTPFLEYGPPPGRTTPPPPPEKHLKYEAIGEPHIKWSPHHINVLYAPAPVAYSPPPPPPPPTLPPYKYQTARPLPAPPVTSPPPVTSSPHKPAVRPHLEYGPPPQVQEHQPAPLPPPPPPQLPYASTGQAALPEPTHRFSLQPTQHHAARHFVKRAADNAIDTYIYRYVDDGSSFNKYGQLQLNAHDKTLGKFAYRYVGSDGVTVDVSRRPA